MLRGIQPPWMSTCLTWISIRTTPQCQPVFRIFLLMLIISRPKIDSVICTQNSFPCRSSVYGFVVRASNNPTTHIMTLANAYERYCCAMHWRKCPHRDRIWLLLVEDHQLVWQLVLKFRTSFRQMVTIVDWLVSSSHLPLTFNHRISSISKWFLFQIRCLPRNGRLPFKIVSLHSFACVIDQF